ncbi:Os05g0239100 [Oryza sativa Japonica Group]|uniref:Os05g0239100 protein n=2 Tax=Oryza sativa subsp. japonica TaxID=39947 RepID=A0A0P0WJY9_ORYSJ|nr:unknown protein [Oryza sativa Japonica Group]KAB8098649.1 hypothetical protein EE612_028077 [Oryza sativa]BAF16910.1 Os05g0239100 [Oryza sativa Japonica Group]BAS92957.1 Os05g0239100 [Oryza sativa Japonica Group]|eukprot:NP_001054996.1 Os05g0239100 [Oryza sativa Japonica Group]
MYVKTIAFPCPWATNCYFCKNLHGIFLKLHGISCILAKNPQQVADRVLTSRDIMAYPCASFSRSTDEQPHQLQQNAQYINPCIVIICVK